MKMPRRNILQLIAIMLVVGSVAMQGAPHGCSSTFFSALVQLIPCRASVMPYSPTPPSDTCCSAIKALGQQCLCVLISGPPISGVDRSMALMLPDKCMSNFGPCEMAREQGRKVRGKEGQLNKGVEERIKGTIIP